MAQRHWGLALRATRLFMPREIIVRADGRVTCLRLSAPVQVAAAALALLLCCGPIFQILHAAGLGERPIVPDREALGTYRDSAARLAAVAGVPFAGSAAIGSDDQTAAAIRSVADSLRGDRGRVAYGNVMLNERLRNIESERASAYARLSELSAGLPDLTYAIAAPELLDHGGDSFAATALRRAIAELGMAEQHGLALEATREDLAVAMATVAEAKNAGSGLVRPLRAEARDLEAQLDLLRGSQPRLRDDLVKAKRALARAAGSWANKQARAKGVELIDYLFPVQRSADELGPEAALVLAVMRQESGFTSEAANASSGASGIMQLMPDTAADLARKLEMEFDQAKLAEDPDYNTKLGQAYLEQLLDRYRGSYLLAIAAYNAGPARVDEWLKTIGDPRKPDMAAEDWIAAIPFRETRIYVRSVLLSQAVYERRLQVQEEIPLQTAERVPAEASPR